MPQHLFEQHSWSPLHVWPTGLHIGAAVHAPLSHAPRQHWLPSVHAPPSPMQGLQAPPTQRVEQHWLSFEHGVPLPAQLEPPHTPDPLHSWEQHSAGAAHGLPSVLHAPPVLELVLDEVLVLVLLELVLLDVAPPDPPVAALLEDVALVVAPPAPELLLALDEVLESPKRLPSSTPHAPAAIAVVTSANAAARTRRRADCGGAGEAMLTRALYANGARDAGPMRAHFTVGRQTDLMGPMPHPQHAPAFAAVAALGAALAGCFADDQPFAKPGTGGAAPASETTVAMDFAAHDDFYAAPFPTDARLTPEGGVDLEGFPDPFGKDLVARIFTLLKTDARGFGTTSAVYFRLSGPIAEADLPDVMGSVSASSPVALISVDPAAPDFGKRYPISVRFLSDGGPYGAPNLLALLPLSGVPLRPATRYAAVVTRALHDADGAPLGASAGMAALAEGRAPEGMSEAAYASYRAAIAALPQAGVELADVAGLAVFTTDTPDAAMGRVTQAMIASPPAPTKPFAQTDVFDDYCVYATTIGMPEYQRGQPPYEDEGGEWALDAFGNPILQRVEEANFVVTIPRRPMPEAGYPIVVFSRTGGGGERPLVDRGPHAENHGPAIEPGAGPAKWFAAAGFAGSSIDGPHGGLRNITHGDEQFLMFNVGNPGALRDNVRQSAAELALQAHVLGHVAVDVSDCLGADAPGNVARFDTGTMALMGHSMGATIAPLTLAFEPRYRAGLLSGAGGSWIENVIYKQKPLAVKGIAEILVGVAGSGYALSAHDPVLSLFQWAGEAADPPVYARRIVHEPVDGPARHILMMQGIVDHYIMPTIADAASLSLGLDLAGAELDDTVPEIQQFTPLGELLPLVGRKTITLPASGNAGGVTAVVTQHPEDGIEDGHEVVFQTEAPKHEYRCFLEGLAKGKPVVPKPGKATDPCQ